MKNILFLILLFCSTLTAQKTYPYLLIDSVGDQFVVLTLEQAQKLDNATEFSPKLWKENVVYYKLVDSLCNQKLSIKDTQLDSFRLESNFLKEQLETSERLNNLLESKFKMNDELLTQYKSEFEIMKSEKTIYEEKIKLNEKIIKQQRKEMNIVIGFGIVTTIISFLIAI